MVTAHIPNCSFLWEETFQKRRKAELNSGFSLLWPFSFGKMCPFPEHCRLRRKPCTEEAFSATSCADACPGYILKSRSLELLSFFFFFWFLVSFMPRSICSVGCFTILFSNSCLKRKACVPSLWNTEPPGQRGWIPFPEQQGSLFGTPTSILRPVVQPVPEQLVNQLLCVPPTLDSTSCSTTHDTACDFLQQGA